MVRITLVAFEARCAPVRPAVRPGEYRRADHGIDQREEGDNGLQMVFHRAAHDLRRREPCNPGG